MRTCVYDHSGRELRDVIGRHYRVGPAESADTVKPAAQSVLMFLLLVIDGMLNTSELLLKSNNLRLPHNLNAVLYRLG